MSSKLKIAVVNLQSGIGTIRGYTDYIFSAWKYFLPGNHGYIHKAAAILKSENVDIALLTEVNEISFRSRNQSHVKTLEQELSPIESCFFPTIKTGSYLHEGNAILSKYPLRKITTYVLHSVGISRILGESSAIINDRAVTIFVTHLSLSKKHRSLQIARIAEIIKTKTGPLILGGDFNEHDVSMLKPLLSAGFSSIHFQKNFPSWKPNRALDYLFLSKHFTNTHSYIPQTELFSDHAPLIVEVELVEEIEV